MSFFIVHQKHHPRVVVDEVVDGDVLSGYGGEASAHADVA